MGTGFTQSILEGAWGCDQHPKRRGVGGQCRAGGWAGREQVVGGPGLFRWTFSRARLWVWPLSAASDFTKCQHRAGQR